MNYEQIKKFPTSRNAKMVYGIACALMARAMLNTGTTLMETNSDGALIAFIAAGLLVFTTVLAVLRFDSGRPLFETSGR